MDFVVGTMAALAVVALRQSLPDELSDVERFPQMGRGHLAQGEAPPEYNSSPPTSGDHAPLAAECGVYVTEVPDEVQVHNLEHGAVVIQNQTTVFLDVNGEPVDLDDDDAFQLVLDVAESEVGVEEIADRLVTS